MSKKSNKKLRKEASRSSDPIGDLAESVAELRTHAAEATPSQRDKIRRASTGVERSYLRSVAPWHRDSAPSDNAALIGKAQKLRKRDSSMSEYESLIQAARGRTAP